MVTVADNGCGIPKSDLDNVMNAGFRGKKFISKNPAGTGLGLSLALRIAHSHGGELTIESQEGRGTILMITLPILSTLGGEKK